MFTGIVEEVGRVTESSHGRLTVAANVAREMEISGSISINGACLTTVDCAGSSLSVDVVPETLRRTNLGGLTEGDGVNLERPVPAGGRLDGHIVQGHVDGTGTIAGVSEDGQALMVRIETPPSLMRYLVEKGFVAVDGASLTIVQCDGNSFDVTLIPYTASNTVLGTRRAGDRVNIEVDILAKYVERLLAARSG